MNIHPQNGTSGVQPLQALAMENRSIEDAYREHALLLRRVAIRKFHVPLDDADTLVHDVFITYLVDTSVVRSNLRGYLIGAICNASRNYWRSKEVRDRVFVDDADPLEPPDESFFDGLSLHLVLGATLARLGDRCRDVLRRYYLEGEDTQAIASTLDTTPSNVNYMMHVCRKKARAIYDALTKVRA
jgi:RNA polymerase sigma factor (sigma-70 family)